MWELYFECKKIKETFKRPISNSHKHNVLLQFRFPFSLDIRPNHTKTNKKHPKKPNKQPKTNTHGFLFLMDRTGNFLITGFPQTKRCKNIEVWEFSTPPDMSGGCGKLPKVKVIW